MSSPTDIPFAETVDNFFSCERCGHDLSRLPAKARFCPHCGLDQLKTAAALVLPEYETPPPPASPLPPLDMPPTPPDNGLPMISSLEERDFHSIVIEGYARAMTGLGVRYESGVGAMRNDDEALRCYCKAAKLGSDEAKSRLEQRGAISPDAPSDPPSPPEATESQNP